MGTTTGWGAGLLLLTTLVGWSSPASAQGSVVLETRWFSFHSDPWINLHHFLYQWSRADLGIGEGRTAVAVPEREELRNLNEGERKAWEEALVFYRARVAERDHFDDGMLELKDALLALDGDPSASPPDDIPGVARALERAMPVYLTRWWPAHDRANRTWIGEVGPLVRDNEAGFPILAARSFGGRWPEGLRRVDVSAYANWQGGYTSVRPTHVMIISTSPKTQGLKGMEIAFHEVCHDDEVQGPSRADIRQAFATLGVEPNPNLWHALIFYTSGVYSRRIARALGEADYVPHMVREGISGFAGWRGIWEALDAEWPAVLQGTRDRREALAAVVRRLSQTKGRGRL